MFVNFKAFENIQGGTNTTPAFKKKGEAKSRWLA